LICSAYAFHADSCAEVIKNFFEAGGRLIDSSPMYGSSQGVIGDGLKKLGATKVIDMATLTGAVSIALGDVNAAVLGTDQDLIDEIIAANPKQVEQYRAGKKTVVGFFVGQVMKASKGQANPQMVNELLTKKLE